MVIKSEIQLYIECEPTQDIGHMEEFIKNFNGLLKVQIEDFVGYGVSVKHVNVGIRTNVSK